MSKASDYAVRAKAALDQPAFKARSGKYPLVTKEGELRIYAAVMAPDEALDFAHWIIDTFGEPKKK